METPIQPVQPTKPDRKSKIEILSQIKKLAEKNGYHISDDELIKLFGIFNTDTPSVENGKMFCLSAKLDNTPKQTIKILPKKLIFIEKYDENIDFNDELFRRMEENFNNPKLFKPYVDIEHQLGEKYADIVGLETRQDGLYAHIELNEAGKALIKENKYSYISPEWGDRKDTEGTEHRDVLVAVTLTNIPALEGELPTLQSQIKLTKGEFMDFNTRLAKLEGKLSTKKLQEEGAESAIPPEIMEAIGMIKEAVMKIDELTQQKDVAEEEAMKFKKMYEEKEKEEALKEKESFFETALENGQLEAGELEDWQNQYDKSKDFVVKMLSSRPTKDNKQLSSGSPGTTKLSKEDYRIGEQFGYDMDDPKDVKKYKKDVGELKVYKSSVEEG